MDKGLVKDGVEGILLLVQERARNFHGLARVVNSNAGLKLLLLPLVSVALEKIK
jgi:hypothetical protein